jgi:hypothetical protein
MANAHTLTAAVVQGMLNGTALATAMNAGTGAVLEIYSGAVPATADAAQVSPTLLARLQLSKPAFGSVVANSGVNAVATFAAITNAVAAATGTAAYFRILTQAAGTTIDQGTVGTTGCDLNLNTTAITAGSTVSITSGTMTQPVG